MKNLLLATALLMITATSFASDAVCIGKLAGEPAKISITGTEGDMVKVSIKLADSTLRGTGVVIENKDVGYAITSIITSDGEALLLKINISRDFSTSSAVLTQGSKVSRSKLACVKN